MISKPCGFGVLALRRGPRECPGQPGGRWRGWKSGSSPILRREGWREGNRRELGALHSLTPHSQSSEAAGDPLGLGLRVESLGNPAGLSLCRAQGGALCSLMGSCLSAWQHHRCLSPPAAGTGAPAATLSLHLALQEVGNQETGESAPLSPSSWHCTGDSDWPSGSGPTPGQLAVARGWGLMPQWGPVPQGTERWRACRAATQSRFMACPGENSLGGGEQVSSQLCLSPPGGHSKDHTRHPWLTPVLFGFSSIRLPTPLHLWNTRSVVTSHGQIPGVLPVITRTSQNQRTHWPHPLPKEAPGTSLLPMWLLPGLCSRLASLLPNH